MRSGHRLADFEGRERVLYMSSVPYVLYMDVHLQTGLVYSAPSPLGTKADVHDIVTGQHGPTGRRGDIFAAAGAVRKCTGDPRGKLSSC